jgi:hypothetical protein
VTPSEPVTPGPVWSLFSEKNGKNTERLSIKIPSIGHDVKEKPPKQMKTTASSASMILSDFESDSDASSICHSPGWSTFGAKRKQKARRPEKENVGDILGQEKSLSIPKKLFKPKPIARSTSEPVLSVLPRTLKSRVIGHFLERPRRNHGTERAKQARNDSLRSAKGSSVLDFTKNDMQHPLQREGFYKPVKSETSQDFKGLPAASEFPTALEVMRHEQLSAQFIEGKSDGYISRSDSQESSHSKYPSMSPADLGEVPPPHAQGVFNLVPDQDGTILHPRYGNRRDSNFELHAASNELNPITFLETDSRLDVFNSVNLASLSLKDRSTRSSAASQNSILSLPFQGLPPAAEVLTGRSILDEPYDYSSSTQNSEKVRQDSIENVSELNYATQVEYHAYLEDPDTDPPGPQRTFYTSGRLLDSNNSETRGTSQCYASAALPARDQPYSSTSLRSGEKECYHGQRLERWTPSPGHIDYQVSDKMASAKRQDLQIGFPQEAFGNPSPSSSQPEMSQSHNHQMKGDKLREFRSIQDFFVDGANGDHIVRPSIPRSNPRDSPSALGLRSKESSTKTRRTSSREGQTDHASSNNYGRSKSGGRHLKSVENGRAIGYPPSKGQTQDDNSEGSRKPELTPFAKMLVVCCGCGFFHDLPSTMYEAMVAYSDAKKLEDSALPGPIVSARLRCPWCSHTMTTKCCAGYSAVVYLREQFH